MELEALHQLAALVGDFEPGTVALIGAGPGDSTLVTVRGAVRLAQAGTPGTGRAGRRVRLCREMARRAGPNAGADQRLAHRARSGG